METEYAGSPDVTVLVPAAGEGRRLGGARKQFRDLGGAPLLVQTLRVFDGHPEISRIIVVTLPDEVDGVCRSLTDHGIAHLADVVPGGATRQQSVRCGLQVVPERSDVVLIHDAVRPFVTPGEVTEVVVASRLHGAASVAIPVVDTLREASAGLFGSTVARDNLYRMQTPQGFRRDLIVKAHESALAAGVQATDDVELAQMSGHDVYVVGGSSNNFKITTAEDWLRAQRIWPTWSAENLA